MFSSSCAATCTPAMLWTSERFFHRSISICEASHDVLATSGSVDSHESLRLKAISRHDQRIHVKMEACCWGNEDFGSNFRTDHYGP